MADVAAEGDGDDAVADGEAFEGERFRLAVDVHEPVVVREGEGLQEAAPLVRSISRITPAWRANGVRMLQNGMSRRPSYAGFGFFLLDCAGPQILCSEDT